MITFIHTIERDGDHREDERTGQLAIPEMRTPRPAAVAISYHRERSDQLKRRDPNWDKCAHERNPEDQLCEAALVNDSEQLSQKTNNGSDALGTLC